MYLEQLCAGIEEDDSIESWPNLFIFFFGIEGFSSIKKISKTF